jgi:CcmD family protein
MRRLLTAGWMFCASVARIQALQPTTGQEQWIPIDQLPPADQLPAAPLLIGAYAFVWLVTMAYLWSIWRRLGKIEDEMRALQRRGSQRSGVR